MSSQDVAGGTVLIDCNVQPEIPEWADKVNPIIQHTLCGMIDPARFAAVTVFTDADGDTLADGEFIIRANKLSDSMNACAFDFYSKPENWKYLPADVNVIFFPQTIFRHSGGCSYVRCLSRHPHEKRWYGGYDRIGFPFGRRCRVAVLTGIQPSIV